MTTDLKELALAATPGPWTGFVDKGRLVAITPSGRPCDICTFADPPSDADAAFMLAATPDAILDLIRERDEARERIAEQEREYQRERIVQVREINARLAAEAALSAAQEEVARYKRKLMQGEAILAGWTRIDRIKLAAGEMTAQEARTGLAVAKGIAASVRSAVAALAVMECGGEAKGACPACGCEEANSRNLWTCECPAPRPEAVGEDGG